MGTCGEPARERISGVALNVVIASWSKIEKRSDVAVDAVTVFPFMVENRSDIVVHAASVSWCMI